MAARGLTRALHSNLHSLAEELSPWRLLPPLAATLQPLLAAHPERHAYLDTLVSRLRARNALHPFTFFPEGFESRGGAPAGALPAIRAAAAAAGGAPAAPPPGLVLAPSPHGRASAHVFEGSFPAPPETAALLPPASRVARFQLVAPPAWRRGGPAALLLPGTGEQGFTRRRHFLAYPLASQGVATVILEGPFYGARRPAGMVASKLRALCDLPLLGLSTMLEARALVAWLKGELGASAVVLAGTSMGGLHAAMTASLLPRTPVGALSWLGPPSGVGVFTGGSLACAVDWAALAAGAGAPHVEAGVAAMEALARRGAFASSLPAPAAVEALAGHWPRVPRDALARGVGLAARLLRITDLGAFPPPAAPRLATFVNAAQDAYIPHDAEHWGAIAAEWRGAAVKRLQAGHVSGSLALGEYRDQIVQLAARVGREQ